MIAKIIKGSNFKGVVDYILDKEKDAKILICDGLFAENQETIAGSFEAQARMKPKESDKACRSHRVGVLQGG